MLPTGAGHDAGVLAAHVPTAMLFVRNPTGVSHAPAEHATDADCAAGVDALAARAGGPGVPVTRHGYWRRVRLARRPAPAPAGTC